MGKKRKLISKISIEWKIDCQINVIKFQERKEKVIRLSELKSDPEENIQNNKLNKEQFYYAFKFDFRRTRCCLQIIKNNEKKNMQWGIIYFLNQVTVRFRSSSVTFGKIEKKNR